MVHAQNALMTQSKRDLTGMAHGHGWGVATYENETPHVERQAWAAHHGEHFERAAARIYTDVVLAHVRRATVGGAHIKNTHPFSFGDWAFAHNGTAPHFAIVKEKLLAEIDETHRKEIKGETDSEHLFYYWLSVYERAGDDDMDRALRTVIANTRDWVREIDERVEIGLNLIVTDGRRMVGSRLGRTLYYIERSGVYDCEICGFPHVHHDKKKSYRAVVVASEPITHENWNEIPEGSIWRTSGDTGRIKIAAL